MLDKIAVAILAGGKGTRLAGVLPERMPKCMAPIGRGLFLDILLDQLSKRHVRRVHLCLGVSADRVSYAPGFDLRMQITRTIEPEPFGTAGALAFAAEHLKTDPVMVLNGDTLIDATADDVAAFLSFHDERRPLASVWMSGDARIAYLLSAYAMSVLQKVRRGDLDDFIDGLGTDSYAVARYETDTQFIDIGTPEAYRQADFIARVVV